MLMERSEQSSRDLALRALCFLLCIPAVGALLAKMYGVASMQRTSIFVALPAGVALVAIWWWNSKTRERKIADALEIGVVGGMLGTIAYDIARLPFALAGWRVFATISAFGIWLANAPASSRYTEVLGWSYHYVNGITFGIMYALFMANRHWAWAVLWGCLLETIALSSPFGPIFNLTGNYPAIAIAYFGHVGYGIPLGIVVEHWSKSIEIIATTPPVLRWTIAAIVAAALVGPIASSEQQGRDLARTADTFDVDGNLLNPGWLRIERGKQVVVRNHGTVPVSIEVKQSHIDANLPIGASMPLKFEKPGIYQVFVKTDARSHSSFVIVEPVEDR
jgi:hypothetical protein